MANVFNYHLSKDEISKINFHTLMQYANLKSVSQIEKDYSIERVRIHQLVAEKRIPGAVKLGNAWYFDMNHAEPFFDAYADWTFERYIDRLSKIYRPKIYDYIKKAQSNVDTGFCYTDPFDDNIYLMPAEFKSNQYAYAEKIGDWRYNSGFVFNVEGEGRSKQEYVNNVYASLRASDKIYEERS